MKMKRKKFGLSKVLVIFVMLFLIVLLGQNAVGAKTLKITLTNAPDHPASLGLAQFSERVKELTGGEIVVDLFTSGVLGGEREIVEAVQLGQIEMGSVTCGVMSNFAPEFDIFSLPFLFSDYDHVKRVYMESEKIASIFKAALDRIGLVSLGLTTSGTRNVYANKPIYKPEDFRGLKIRTMEVPTIVETMKVFGTIPVPMAYDEVYQALQSGVIDGAETSLINWIKSKHVEVVKYGARLNYMDSGRVYFANKKIFEELSAEQRDIIKKAMRESFEFIHGEYETQDSDSMIEKLAKPYGGVVTYPDLKPFVEMCQPVYEKFEPTLGLDMLKEIQDM